MPSLRRVLSCFALVVVAAGGCSRDKGHAPPAGVPALPGGAEAAGMPTPPPTGESGVHDSPEGALPPGHPSLPPDHPAMPGEAQPGAPQPAAFDPKAVVKGSIDVAPALKDKVQPTDVIYVSVRVDDGTEKGALLGAKRLTPGTWPLAFQVDGRDAMSTQPLAGKVLVVVRVDKDGDAMSHNPGDLWGEAHAAVPADVKVVVDKAL